MIVASGEVGGGGGGGGGGEEGARDVYLLVAKNILVESA